MIRLTDLGLVCALGNDKKTILVNLLSGASPGLVHRSGYLPDRPVWVGEVQATLPDLSEFPEVFRSRCNQLAMLAWSQIATKVRECDYAPERVAVVLGTSTSGIREGESALSELQQEGDMPSRYHYATQEMNAPADFIAYLSGAKGPVYCISTACSSAAKAMISAWRLLNAGVVDAVITGGVDSLCKLTVNGFAALESVSPDRCKPFCIDRDGINIGEGAALFLMHKAQTGVRLAGYGECSDAYHISAPHPDGKGATEAMKQAIHRAGIDVEQLDYLNLHGTATPQNDQMEAKAVSQLMPKVPCSSTKPLTGHALGAAAAIEAGLCWLLMAEDNSTNALPGTICQGQQDHSLASIRLLRESQIANRSINYCLSNSFAFGGNNAALLLARD